MKRLNRDEEAVSPVIATILMVAITVVLAATLYMMVGDIGGEGDTDLVLSVSGEVDEDGVFEVEMDRMSTPSSADPGDVEFTVIDEDEGTEETFTGDDGSWILLDDDDVTTGSEGTFDPDEADLDVDASDFIDADRIVVSIDGYAGNEDIDL